jgi:hypothetical protein
MPSRLSLILLQEGSNRGKGKGAAYDYLHEHGDP